MKNNSGINKIYAKTILAAIAILFISCANQEKIIIRKNFTESVEDKSITIPELSKHVFYLASDSMNGRETGSKEYLRAANYCAEQLRKTGIQPLLKDSANNLTYFQNVQYSYITVSGGNYLNIKANGLEYQFPNSLSFKVKNPGNFGDGISPLKIVFSGYGISAPEYGWDDFKDLEIEGKAVIVMKGEPVRDGKPVIPIKDNHQKIMDYRSNIIERKAAAIIEIADKSEVEKWYSVRDNKKDQLTYIGKKSICEIIGMPDIVNVLFKDQIYNPAIKEKKGKNEYKTFELNDVSVNFDCEFHEKDRYLSPNIIGVVKGTDAKLANQYVVVGAHLDHIGPGYNGADDNASGCAGLLEIARAVAMKPSKRSILFILFSGEETGLSGSGYFVENSPVSTDSIIAMINLDMIGRSTEKYEKERTHYIAGIGDTGERMLEFVDEVNRQTYNWPLKRLTSKEGNCSGSDHARFAEKGIPSVFFFSGQHNDLHCHSDKPEKIDFDKMQVIARLAYEVACRMANR